MVRGPQFEKRCFRPFSSLHSACPSLTTKIYVSYATLCVYFYVKKKSSELNSDSELQQSAQHNVWTQQHGSKSGLEKTVWRGASWVVPFDRHISEKMKGNSDDTDETNRHRREEKGLNVGSLSHDNSRLHISACTHITRRIQVRNFRAFSTQYQPCTKWLSFVSLCQEISGRPETEVWSKHKTRSAGLAERLGGEHFRRRHTKAGPIRKVP